MQNTTLNETFTHLGTMESFRVTLQASHQELLLLQKIKKGNQDREPIVVLDG
jgi:hypothetical protein